MMFYYGSHVIIMNSYLRLEDKTIQENLDRTIGSLEQAVNAVELSVQDWSIWDDSYQFVIDKNAKFIKSTLAISSFQSIKMDIILFYDVKGKLFYALAVNEDRSKFIPVPDTLLHELTPTSLLVSQPEINSQTSGLLSIPSGILLIASHSIINSDSKGPVHGSLIMAKYLTNQVLANVENIAKVDATIFRLPNAEINNEVRKITADLYSKNSQVIIKNDDRLFGYRFLKDINGKPIAVIKISLPRTIYKIGIDTMHYSNLTVLVYSIFITLLLWMLLQYLIVQRIEKLNKHISQQGRQNKLFSKVIENMSDEVSSVASLYHQATHDPLTGLANRNLLYQAFNHFSQEEHLDNNQKIVILFIDIDHFKRVNDTLGHDVGDEVLITTAKRLTGALRDNDLAARLGGDEFVVMLVDIEKEQVEAITRRIFKTINQPFTFEGHEIYVSSSMGVCIYPDDGTAIETLIKQADVALYHAKEHGRNHYQFYSESLNKTINESHQKEIELQIALDEKQLCLYYQPIYNLRTKQIVALEALIRWEHPTRGLLGPEEIIPIAERTDLIYPIGQWVFQTACKTVKEWQKKGLPVVPVAINVAAGQMRASSLSETVITALKRSALDSNLLEIEITETGFIDMNPKLLSELQALRASGIKLTIDDFGTGYSGLGYLKSLPVSKLKIDKSFIRDIQTDPDDKAITLAIIAIAHQLNLEVVAEGIENLEQYNFMCYHQVDAVQGFFLSPPLDEKSCEKLLSGDFNHQTLNL